MILFNNQINLIGSHPADPLPGGLPWAGAPIGSTLAGSPTLDRGQTGSRSLTRKYEGIQAVCLSPSVPTVREEMPAMSNTVDLNTVKEVYNGAEGDLWELIMGQQIHIGGFQSSMDLSERAGLAGAGQGVDLCCCNGAGMRFLSRFRNVAKMTGVDATETVVARGRERCAAEGLGERINFVHADVCNSGLPAATADFVWGEDAWCYVVDKTKLIAEAARIVKPGGTIAYTDWVAGEVPMSAEESARFLAFMKFPNVQTIAGYRALLEANGCTVAEASDTGRFAPYVDLYLAMVDKQLTYDALRILGWDVNMLGAIAQEMVFLGELAKAGKIAQGRFIARKR